MFFYYLLDVRASFPLRIFPFACSVLYATPISFRVPVRSTVFHVLFVRISFRVNFCLPSVLSSCRGLDLHVFLPRDFPFSLLTLFFEILRSLYCPLYPSDSSLLCVCPVHVAFAIPCRVLTLQPRHAYSGHLTWQHLPALLLHNFKQFFTTPFYRFCRQSLFIPPTILNR